MIILITVLLNPEGDSLATFLNAKDQETNRGGGLNTKIGEGVNREVRSSLLYWGLERFNFVTCARRTTRLPSSCSQECLNGSPGV